MSLSVGSIYSSVDPVVENLENEYEATINALQGTDTDGDGNIDTNMSLSQMLAAQAQLADYSNMQSFLQKTVDNARKMTDETIKANNA